MERICGIYKITNPKNKVYIGQSINILFRWYKYKKLDCKKQCKLYNSLKKYGADNHKFEILCECDKEKLNELEKYYVDLYNSFTSEHGLNLKDGGGQRVGMSEESKKKVGDANRGRLVSDATRKKISIQVRNRGADYREKLSKSHLLRNANKVKKIKPPKLKRVWSIDDKKKMSERMKGNTYRRGKKMPLEYVEMMSKRMKGNTYTLGFKQSDETKEKMRIANRGRSHTEETKQKISERQKGNTYWLGKKHTEEWKKMMSDRNKGQVSWAKGQKFSDEHKRKISESCKKTRNKEKYALIGQIITNLILR